MSITWGANEEQALDRAFRSGRMGENQYFIPSAIYNCLIHSMSRVHAASRQLLDRFTPFLLLLLLIPRAAAADWTEPQRQLAQKIAGTTGPGPVFLDVINIAAYGKNDVDAIRRGLATQLSTLGIQLVKSDQAAATVQVSLTQNLQEYVWVAEIRQGNSPVAVVMVTVSRLGAPPAQPRAPGLTIAHTLLWSQANRILDAAVVEISGSPAYLLVLDSTAVHVARFDRGQWKVEQDLPIPNTKPWPRDLRGRLLLRQEHLFDAHLPGLFCSSRGGGSLSISCRESDDAWPVSTGAFAQNAFFVSNRNYFTGALVPGVQQDNSVAPFYSAAPVPRPNYTLWVFATVDGSLQLVDGMTKQNLSGLGWGSDIAGVKSPCGSGWQVIAASNTDNSADAVRAFEFPDREPVPVSPVVDFAGPVTALWSETDGSAAVAVIHNLETDRYEAHRLSISCGQ